MVIKEAAEMEEMVKTMEGGTEAMVDEDGEAAVTEVGEIEAGEMGEEELCEEEEEDAEVVEDEEEVVMEVEEGMDTARRMKRPRITGEDTVKVEVVVAAGVAVVMAGIVNSKADMELRPRDHHLHLKIRMIARLFA